MEWQEMSELGARALLTTLSVMGLMISTYLTWGYLTGEPPVCVVGQAGCAAVQSSPYSVVLGIPLTAFGIVGYAALLYSALLKSRRGAVLGVLIGVAGVVFAAFRMWQEFFLIGAFCEWCVVSALIMVGCFVLAVVRFRRLSKG
jgi:uncharacterized membrane protein